jgi:hypothetical protein
VHDLRGIIKNRTFIHAGIFGSADILVTLNLEQIMSDSRIPATGSPRCGTPVACTPRPPPWIEFRVPSVWGEANGGSVLPPRGTKRFRDEAGMRTEHGDSIRGVRRTDPPPPGKRRAEVQNTAVSFKPF